MTVLPWDALAQPPTDASTVEKVRWKFAHIESFQQAHPDLPQGSWLTLRARDQKLITVQYDLTVAKAQCGGDLPAEIEKAIRTGTVVVRSSSSKRQAASK
jgi:hypothetical protein